MEKLEKILKTTANTTKKSGLEPTSDTQANQEDDTAYSIGDPNCPLCHGLGYIRSEVDFGDPDFGKMKICVCRLDEIRLNNQKRLFKLSNLSALKNLTFDSFIPTGRVGLGKQQAESLQQAYNHAKNFAGSLSGWLLLSGRYGCGKTHLAAAIANHVVEKGITTLFLTVPDLLDWLRSSYSDTGEDSFDIRFNEIKNVEVLILDDFGTQNATNWAQEKLFQLINYRYINRLATVITSNFNLSDFEGRIRSRLMDPDLVNQVNITAPDFRNPKDDVGHHELSTLNFHSKQTFGTFSLRKDENIPSEDLKSLQRAFEIAQDFAKTPSGWLLFTGPYGCGKTHLAAAIGNYQAGLGFPPLMVVVPDLLDHLRATFSPHSNVSLDRRFDEIKTSRFLILDDLGTQSATPWAREKLYQLFNYRYNAELPTVITTASTPDELDQRLYSRMADARLCRIAVMSVPGYRGKIREQHRKY